MDTLQETSTACSVAAARTDRTAFAALFRRHYDEIFRYCARRLPGRDTAEDITSQVFMKMIRKFNTFSGDATAFRYWLFRIACNEVNSYYRAAGRQAATFEKMRQEYAPPEQPDVEGDCAEAEDNARKLAFLQSTIAGLKPPLQDIITLRFFEGMNSEQIGEVLGLKATTVRSRLARALRKLKSAYKIQQQHLRQGDRWYE